MAPSSKAASTAASSFSASTSSGSGSSGRTSPIGQGSSWFTVEVTGTVS